jgi:hypothetical protein
MKTVNTTFKLTNGVKSINPWDLDDHPESWIGGEKPANPVALVPAIQSAWQARCKAISDLPFCIYGKGDKEIDNSDDYQNVIGFLPNPRHFLWLTEAALVGYGKAYWSKAMNKYLVVKEMQYFVPTSIKEKISNNDGLEYFERNNGKQTLKYKPEQLLYIWLADPAVELGPPTVWPLAAALLSAGALGQINIFVNDYMARGAVKALLLAATNMPSAEEAERVEKWFNKFMRGIRNLQWKVFNADVIKPEVVGEGLEAFKGITILDDLTRQVHTAMGTRHMLEDENYATADVRQREFYSNTVVPEARIIADAMNEQILNGMGYHLEFEPERLEVFQADEAENATALGSLAGAIGGQSPEVIELSMSILGYDLTEDQKLMLEGIKKQKEENKQKLDEQMNKEPDDSTDTSSPIPAFQDNLNKWMRKACKHIGKDVNFVCDDIPADIQAQIHGALLNCKSEAEVRSAFAISETVSDFPVFAQPDYSGLIEALRLECQLIKEANQMPTIKIYNNVPDMEEYKPPIINNIISPTPVTVQNEIKVEPTPIENTIKVEPTPVTIQNDVKVPAVKEVKSQDGLAKGPKHRVEKQKVLRDKDNQITGTETHIDYEY